MIITAQEKLMYEVMKSIYESGIPISFKGSMVLKACLMEAGYPEDIRHTFDIDANWYSNTPPSADQMKASLQKAIDRNGLDLDIKLTRMYGEGRSAGFKLYDRFSGEELFTLDMDVNRHPIKTKIYEVDGLCFSGASPDSMITDKVVSISSDKVFRRIKDVIDLYYISKVFGFDKESFMHTLQKSERSMGDFNGFLNRKEELRHAYEKFRFSGNVRKAPFDEVYSAVLGYISVLLPISENTVDMMDKSMRNLDEGKAGKAVDVSKFKESSMGEVLK